MDGSRQTRYASARIRFLMAPVAQLDRVLPSEGRGRAFESRRARHISRGLAFRVRPSPSRDYVVTKL